MTTMEDTAELVRAAAAGSSEAWAALVERHTGLLWAVARGYRLSTSDAAEVVQTCWLRLVEHLDRLHDPSKVGGWLATTARHEALRTLRHADRQAPSEDVEEAADARPTYESVEGEVLTAERDRLLREALTRLPDRCRILLRLLMADPPPRYEDVSAALDMPIGSIGPTRARCLRRLRQEVEGMGITSDRRASIE